MKKFKPSAGLDAAVEAAWRLVESCGLSKKAFNAASLATLTNALWLISKGVPAAAVVRAMNANPYAGKRELVRMRRRKERELRETLNRAHSPKKLQFVLRAAELAALLARLDLGALIAELCAWVETESEPLARQIHLAMQASYRKRHR
jgi:hypothetical protein